MAQTAADPCHPFIRIHTDGSCLGNPGPGGYAAILQRIEGDGSVSRALTVNDGADHTTNNRMELMAAIAALRALKRAELPVVVVSDSGYVRGGITEWIGKWKANGWRTSARKPVLNEDLWRELDALAATQRIEWRWVKGHAGNPMNEEADRLARQEAEKRAAAIQTESAA